MEVPSLFLRVSIVVDESVSGVFTVVVLFVLGRVTVVDDSGVVGVVTTVVEPSLVVVTLLVAESAFAKVAKKNSASAAQIVEFKIFMTISFYVDK